MATTTPNFGWPVPTSTDLVKDGATAIEGLGDAIDASLLDLKGGTTGQILKKNSNTDMDFVWGAASGGSPLTTKGDLYTYTTADARLGVGADYGFLQALAAEATGLKWNDGSWTSYTPTLTAASGTFTSATVTGRYIRVGKLVVVQQSVAVTTNGTAAGEARVTLPFTASSNINVGAGREVNVTGSMLQGEVNTTYIGWRNYDNSYPLGNSRTIFCTAAYEVA